MKKKYFSLLITFLTLITVIVGVRVVGDISRNLDFRKKASEEKTSIPVSHWIPIKLSEFNRDLDNQTAIINQKIFNLQPDSTTTQTSIDIQKITFNNSLKIQKELRDGFSLMDVNKDGEIDYQEFNSNIVNVSSSVYNLRHSKVNDKPKGIYSENWSNISDQNDSLSSRDKKSYIRLIVEAGIYSNLKIPLKTYMNDIEKDNPDYQVKIYHCNGCTKEEIKSLLKRRGTAGAIFVGDIPTAWYQTNGCFGWWGFQEYFPTDLYYMDLNGIWGGESDCGSVMCFTTHEGNKQPEIFVARLTPPVEYQKTDLLKKYFIKNHNYRQNGNNIPARSLNYIDDDWYFSARSWTLDIIPAYPIFDLIFSRNTTNAADYKNRWQDGYEHLLVAVHSNYYQHYFISPWINNEEVGWTEVENQKPKVNFYNLFACSNALYTIENYMAGWYVFQESDHGLVAVGSTKTGAMLNFNNFYQPLSLQKNFGTAFKEWFINSYAYNDKCWHGGMVMIGDPTLKTTHVNATPMPIPTFEPTATPTVTPTPIVTVTPTTKSTLTPTGSSYPTRTPQSTPISTNKPRFRFF